ncbi:MAG: nonstructural protein [Microviridae sp.]|nr:MAG: nonstructural protein [Microviridae sp.]
MVLNAYSIYDVKAANYRTPFFCSTNGMATRMFSDLAADQQSIVFKHPDDFKLYFIGTFDDYSGELDRVNVPEFLATASDFMAKA